MLDPIRAKAKAIGLTAVAFLGGTLFASGLDWTAESQAASLFQQSPLPSASEVQPIAELSEAFTSISESVTPAVVNISAESTRTVGRDVPEPFRRFFDMPEGGQEIPQAAGGTGFLITDDGYIMTNNHVVEGAQRIRVTLADRRVFDAEVVGRDPTTDIAVIKIEGEDLPTARLGNSEASRVGQWVLAIGNPLGLEGTVTAGIISAKGRPLGIIGQSLGDNAPSAIETFIQTDAAINPGNSGGPLVNLRGEVIGVNSAIASPTGFSAGYGFAVPMDLARRVANDLIRYGRSRRPVLGVLVGQVSPVDAEAYGLSRVTGAAVQDLSEDSPAREAGIQPEDVIVAIDGEPIERSNELQQEIATRQPGETVTVDVIRYGERLQFDVTLGEAPAPEVATTEERMEGRVDERLGIQVAPLTPELAQRIGFNEAGGVVIMDVRRLSPASRAQLPRGSRILQVDRQDISDVDEFQRLLETKEPGEIVSLRVELPPGGQQSTVNIRIPA